MVQRWEHAVYLCGGVLAAGAIAFLGMLKSVGVWAAVTVLCFGALPTLVWLLGSLTASVGVGLYCLSKQAPKTPLKERSRLGQLAAVLPGRLLTFLSFALGIFVGWLFPTPRRRIAFVDSSRDLLGFAALGVFCVVLAWGIRFSWAAASATRDFQGSEHCSDEPLVGFIKAFNSGSVGGWMAVLIAGVDALVLWWLSWLTLAIR
jgi:hypothetical protein